MGRVRSRRLHLELVRPLVLVAATTVVADRSADAHAVGGVDPSAATTVIEIVVDRSEVRLEIETGVPDLVVFADLFPDDFRVRMGLASEPEGPRFRRFLAERLVIRPDGGTPLAGEVVSFETRPRLSRGSPTSASATATARGNEPVAVVGLRYPFRKRPGRLEIGVPAESETSPGATIDVVASHFGVPLTELVPFDGDLVLDLDWADPWRSKVRDRRLRRRFDGPLMVFLYVEADELRVEVVARPLDLQPSTDLGVEGLVTYPVEIQGEVASRAAAFLGDQLDLTVDGQMLRPALDRVDFRERTRRPATVIDPPRELDAVSATVGAVFSHPLAGVPSEVVAAWDLFPEGIDRVPAAIVDGTGAQRSILHREAHVVRWSKRLGDVGRPAPIEVPPVPTTADTVARWTIWLALAAVSVALLRAAARAAGGEAGWGEVWLLGLVVVGLGVAVRSTTAAAVVGDERVAEIASALLGNVYRACDLRDEASAARELAHSVAGDRLAAEMLEQARQSELVGVDGVRARVRAVELIAAEVVDMTGVVTARCAWTVTSEAGHWGHLHRRVEGHAAELGLEPVEGAWKIVSFEAVDAPGR